MKFKMIAALTLTLLSLAGCKTTTTKEPTEVSVDITGQTMCKEPRPQVCPMNYDPVCATHKDGSKTTAPNGCGACSNQDVVSYILAECT